MSTRSRAVSYPLLGGPVVLALALFAGFLLRAVLGVRDDGIYWPDEIYQSLEPAHRAVFGYGLVAWEFADGARHWAFPGLVSGVLFAARALGMDSPAEYLPLVRVLFILVAIATALGVHRLSRTLGASPLAAAAGASVFALAGPIVYFGHRAMSETASALAVVFGFALMLASPSARRWRFYLGASLLGLAVLLRLHNGLFCLGMLGILAGRRRGADLIRCALVLAAWAVLFGLIDKLTWGGWFHSALRYLEFNLVEGRASQFGVAPWYWYARVLWRSMPWVTVPLGAGVLLSARQAPGVLATALVFLAAHSITPHKELRFLLPVMPILCALAAVGMTALSRRLPARAAAIPPAVLVLAAAGSGARASSLTFGQLGAYGSARAGASAWGDFAGVNRLLLQAGQLPDLCGIKVESVHQAWTGGYTFLHRDVPFYPHSGPTRSSRRFNYVITSFEGGEIIARAGPHVLARIGPDCIADPQYVPRLP
jgi:phosphatidylinositol glycan class B